MNLIKQNALKLLELMVNSGEEHFENSWCQNQSSLSPQEIKDGIFYLEREGAVTVIKGMGSAPFGFLLVNLTANGRYLYHEWRPQDNLGSTQDQAKGEVMDKKKVFIVLGRNKAANDALFSFLRAIGLNPIEWNQAVDLTGKAAPYVGDVLEKAFSNAVAAIVFLTGDDEAKLRDDPLESGDQAYERRLTPQARPNVLFEAGMAFGKHADRTVIIELGALRPFTDISGRHTIRLNNSTERRQELAQRLIAAGCDVDLSGTQWHTVGDFETAVLNQNMKNQLYFDRDRQKYTDNVRTNDKDACYFWVYVRNPHPNKTATNCYVFLEKIKDISNNVNLLNDRLEIKWSGYTLPNAVIAPQDGRYFDAFYIFKENPKDIKINVFTDYSGFIPKVEGPGEFEMTFALISDNFPPVKATFNLKVGESLDDIIFVQAD